MAQSFKSWVFAATLLLVAVSLAMADDKAAENFQNLRRVPDAVSVVTETNTLELQPQAGGLWRSGGVELRTHIQRDGLRVELIAPGIAIKHLQLTWKGSLATNWKYLGDAWERAYGDLEWKPLDGQRVMPWYFLASSGKLTHGYGVKTGPAALCHWTADATGITLHADVRCGGMGVQLGSRKLGVCTVVCRNGTGGETAFEAAVAFCRQMCPNPCLPAQPVYGFNDWYCSYGKDTADGFLKNAAYTVSLAPKGRNRPFAVVDDGWQAKDEKGDGPGYGPWNTNNKRFSDALTMPQFAERIRSVGARPGIWCRPLLANPDHPESWRLARDHHYLDPTVPEVRDYIRQTMKRLHAWGFELIKHDFSTYDITGRWGSEMKKETTVDGWAFSDRSRTTAEVIRDFYMDIRESAGKNTVILGCNTIGHLSAGIFELQRIGDDTSGREWARTRKMGVNSLAFRAPQQGTFFAVDGDCAGQVTTDSVPWEKNRQWLDLLSRSGTPLFVSFPRDTVSPVQEQALRVALAAAARRQLLAEPIDWQEKRTPAMWKLDGEKVEFSW
ncbi:MAG: glycoside hydrolase clan [Pedosphaera sp.]|nr:glycoside hydrolase clan [Pedosphaera sp.]